MAEIIGVATRLCVNFVIQRKETKVSNIEVHHIESFKVNFKDDNGRWFTAIKSNAGWFLYFGQDYLGTFASVDKCQEYLEEHNG